MINIHLPSEYIFYLFGFGVTNTLLTSFLVSLVLMCLVVVIQLFDYRGRWLVTKGLQVIVFELLKLTDMVTGDRNLSKKLFPLIGTFFLFIVSANLLAMVPGFLGSFYVKMGEGNVPLLRSPNSDLNTTLALALTSVLAIQFFSLRVLGTKNYIKRFVNFTSPVRFVLGFFELVSELVKISSFSFRLFGNVFAGEVLLLVIGFLVPYFLPLPFMILEVFVGVIQAFIFAVLTLTFVKTSTLKSI